MRGGSNPTTKTCILYCYHETEATHKNLKFFVKNGVFDSDNYAYNFIINNNICNVELPPYKNIKVMKRAENETDLQSYKWAITELEKESPEYFKGFSNVYFINSSCIGPFMPTICDKNWIDHMNTVSHGVDLIGPVIEFPPDTNGYNALSIKSDKNIPFLHTYMFGTSGNGIGIIRKTLLDMSPDISKVDIVNVIERKLTSAVLTGGGKIKSLLLRFKNVDVNDEKVWNTTMWNSKGAPTCYEVPGNYFGIDVNPLEVIFVKNIRNKNETRGETMAGISETLSKYMKNYIDWGM
jgi:hypothetical protein